MIGIYKITNKTNGKSYIGKSVDIEKRFNEHKKYQRDKNKTLYKAIKKYGVENFSFEIIDICGKEELDEKEIYYIRKFNTFVSGYNMTVGGDGGDTWSKNKNREKTIKKQKISFSKTIKNMPKERFEEWHRKIGQRQKGKTFSEETREKIRQSLLKHNKKHPMSEETKYKMSISRIGRKQSEHVKNVISIARSKSVYQFNKDGSFVRMYKSAKLAEKETGISKANISSCCNRKRPNAGGYLWSFNNCLTQEKK